MRRTKTAPFALAAALMVALAAPSAHAEFLPTPGVRDAPTSPTVVGPYGDVMVTGSVGLPSNKPLAAAGECVAAHAACPLSGGSTPGQSCQCFVPGIGVEFGFTR